MPSSTPQQHASRSPGTIPLSERQQMALLSRMTEEQKQHHSNVSVNKHGETPLHIAAKQGSEDEVQELLSKGVDPNCPDAAGWTPLHEACIRGRYNVAKTLILARADVNAKGYQGFTPLHDAAANGHAELINLLLEFGADVTQRNHKGQAPVDVAPEPIKIIFKNRSEKSSTDQTVSQISTRNSVMRRLPPNSKDSSSSSGSGIGSSTASNSSSPSTSSFSGKTSSSSPRVTLRINQLKGRTNEDSPKRCKINLASQGGVYSSETIDTSSSDQILSPSGGGGGSTSSKIKMENMEEILIKENATPMETNPSQDESKDPLADTENVTSPLSSTVCPSSGGVSGDNKGGGSDKEGEKEIKTETAGNKRHADNVSDDESKKKKRKEETSGTKSKTSSISGGSPKSNLGNESESEDLGILKNVGSPGGPKVPPLKIVLPSSITSSENDLNTNGRNGKSGAPRNTALPYVVPSDTSDTAPNSPVSQGVEIKIEPNTTSNEVDKNNTINTGTSVASPPSIIKQENNSQPPLTAEEQRTNQRILRSTHSRGSSSSSPAAPDASPSTQFNTPPTSAIHSPEAPDSMNIKSEPQSGNEDNKSTSKEEPVSETPSSTDLHHPHPRKRKIKHARDTSLINNSSSSTNNNGNSNGVNGLSTTETKPCSTNGGSAVDVKITTTGVTSALNNSSSSSLSSSGSITGEGDPMAEQIAQSGDQSFTNCYQLYLNIRKQVDQRRKGLFPVKPVTPSTFARYLMVTCDYVLANNNSSRHNIPKFLPAPNIHPQLKDLFVTQEQNRYNLRMQHVVEKEKFALGKEQEILRVHCHAARELANQPLPYSVCTILKDEEVYNLTGPDTDEKDHLEHKKDKRTDRYRYNGRLFIKWLRDIDDKWDKIKKKMINRQTHEAECLHAVQKMDWDWKIKSLMINRTADPASIDVSHVPLITVVDDLQSTDEQTAT